MKNPICVVLVSVLFVSAASIVLADPIVPFPKPPLPHVRLAAADPITPFPKPPRAPYRAVDPVFFAVPDFK
jgi:hypothetical protein